MSHTYDEIISLENLFLAWQEFVIGKRHRRDVIRFRDGVMDNIVELHDELVNRTYRHGPYESFYINDPKRRHIHKASVRDRLVHHAVYRILYPFFDRTFIADSFSCRDDKGTHRAINRFQKLARQVSRNHTRTCWVLKCDIKKFFASIHHQALMDTMRRYIADQDVLRLLQNIIDSFHTEQFPGVGLPLGNLTSQLFANIYMTMFDQWVKHRLRAHYYIRYADDFVFLSADKVWLQTLIPQISDFLRTELQLTLHPDKIMLKTIASGVDFLGWIQFPDHQVLRHKTQQRMMQKIKKSPSEASLQSYLGLLGHGNTAKIRAQLLSEFWLQQ